MSDYYPERDYVQEASDYLQAKDRARDFEGCDGCSTGDCPHNNVNHCVAAQGKIIAEQAAEIERLKGEVHTYHTLWNNLRFGVPNIESEKESYEEAK